MEREVRARRRPPAYGARQQEEKGPDGILIAVIAQCCLCVLVVLGVYLTGYFQGSVQNLLREPYASMIGEQQLFSQVIDFIEDKTGIPLHETAQKLRDSLNGLFLTGKGGQLEVQAQSGGAIPAPENMSLAPLLATAPAIYPVSEYTMTSSYGYRWHPITGKLDFHTGVDLAAPMGARIGAVYPGTVSEIGESEIYGNYIVIDHANGLQSEYCHCSEIVAPLNAKVRQGETVALVGSTGMSTGSHVHLNIMQDGIHYDPMDVLAVLEESSGS